MIRAFFMIVIFGALTGLYALLVEPRQLKVRFETIGSGELTTRFVLISDLHMGGFHTSSDRVEAWVEAINAQEPDYVLLPGDFINGSTSHIDMKADRRSDIQSGFDALSQISAPAIATIGNHDVWHSRRYVNEALESAGIVVLTNEALRLDDFCFVGLDDHDTGLPNPSGYDECEKTDVITTLMHSPDSRGLISANSALAVAGHTHGGQVNLPVIGRRVTATHCGEPCAYGWIQVKPPVFITSGVGTSILPIRFRSPPEIVVITLHYSAPN